MELHGLIQWAGQIDIVKQFLVFHQAVQENIAPREAFYWFCTQYISPLFVHGSLQTGSHLGAQARVAKSEYSKAKLKKVSTSRLVTRLLHEGACSKAMSVATEKTVNRGRSRKNHVLMYWPFFEKKNQRWGGSENIFDLTSKFPIPGFTRALNARVTGANQTLTHAQATMWFFTARGNTDRVNVDSQVPCPMARVYQHQKIWTLKFDLLLLK